MTDWACSVCGIPILEPTVVPRVPCPKCGATARTTRVSLAAECRAEAHLKVHSKHREGGTKVVREVTSGDDYHRKSGRWTYMYRLIDRAHNWYEERFLDRESGKIIHQRAEPLTEHRRSPRR